VEVPLFNEEMKLTSQASDESHRAALSRLGIRPAPWGS